MSGRFSIKDLKENKSFEIWDSFRSNFPAERRVTGSDILHPQSDSPVNRGRELLSRMMKLNLIKNLVLHLAEMKPPQGANNIFLLNCDQQI